MATYLKNTYIDGSLTVEGDLKVQNLDISSIEMPTLVANEFNGNRIPAFNTTNERALQNSILANENNVYSESTVEKIFTRLTVTSSDHRGNNNSDFKSTARFDLSLQVGNTTTKATAFSIGKLDAAKGQELETSAYMVNSTDPYSADSNNDAVFMLPVRQLYLWNQVQQTGHNAPDYKWHYVAQ